jgi:hypothetical protein
MVKQFQVQKKFLLQLLISQYFRARARARARNQNLHHTKPPSHKARKEKFGIATRHRVSVTKNSTLFVSAQ